MKSKRVMFKASIVEVTARSCGQKVICAWCLLKQQAGTRRHRGCSLAVAEAKCRRGGEVYRGYGEEVSDSLHTVSIDVEKARVLAVLPEVHDNFLGLIVFRAWLLSAHHAVSCWTSSLFAVSSPPEMSPTTMPSANSMTVFEGCDTVQSWMWSSRTASHTHKLCG